MILANIFRRVNCPRAKKPEHKLRGRRIDMKRMAASGTAFLLAWLFLSVHAFAAPAVRQQQGGGDVSTMADGKTEGKIRVGLAVVKTGAVGKGVNAAELAGAIQNTLAQYLKGTKIEVVQLEARLASATEAEAKEKGCAYILYATVSHKKGAAASGYSGQSRRCWAASAPWRAWAA
jgi:hypothetical protein